MAGYLWGTECLCHYFVLAAAPPCPNISLPFPSHLLFSPSFLLFLPLSPFLSSRLFPTSILGFRSPSFSLVHFFLLFPPHPGLLVCLPVSPSPISPQHRLLLSQSSMLFILHHSCFYWLWLCFPLSPFYLQPVFVLGWPSLASGPRQSQLWLRLCIHSLPLQPPAPS